MLRVILTLSSVWAYVAKTRFQEKRPLGAFFVPIGFEILIMALSLVPSALYLIHSLIGSMN